MKRKSIHFLLLVFACILGVMTFSCNNEPADRGRSIANEVVSAIRQLETADRDSAIIKLSPSDNAGSVTVMPPDSLRKYDINIYVTDHDNSSDFMAGESFIAIFAIFLIFGIPIIIAIIICVCIFRIKQSSDKVTLAAIEKGYVLPGKNVSMSEYRLQSGVKMIAWAVGLFLFFMVVNAPSVAALATIPLIIGIGRLASYYLARKKEKQSRAGIPSVPGITENPTAEKQEFTEGDNAL